MFNITTKKFIGENEKVRKLLAAQVEWQRGEKGQYQMTEVPGSEFELNADLVILAMGFEHPVHEGLADGMGAKFDQRGNFAVDGRYMTNVEGVFATGDAKRGASLFLRPIQKCPETAKHIHGYSHR